MSKLYYLAALVIYISSTVITRIFDIDTHNTLWSAMFFLLLFLPLNMGCAVNSGIYRKKDSPLRFLFYYFSFMCSLAILLIAGLTPIILKKTSECLIVLAAYIVTALVFTVCYLLRKKCDNKKIYGYFSVLFTLSAIILFVIFIFVKN